jgi:hypothetical protein
MNATITCEHCHNKCLLARDLSGPCEFHIICPACEITLKVRVTEDDFTSVWLRRMGVIKDNEG